MIAAFACAAVGVWLLVAPAVLGYGAEQAATSDRVAGPIIIALSIAATSSATRAVLLAVLPVGLWLVVGPPLVLSAPLGASVSSMGSGLVCVALSASALRTGSTRGMRWRSLQHAGGCGRLDSVRSPDAKR